MNPLDHAKSSARKFGGKLEDYMPIHLWFDHSKQFFADPRHRALRHHGEGIRMAETVFGFIVHNSDEQPVSVRAIGEQHVVEDLGWVPSLQDWLKHIQIQPWMMKAPLRVLRGKSPRGPLGGPVVILRKEETNDPQATTPGPTTQGSEATD